MQQAPSTLVRLQQLAATFIHWMRLAAEMGVLFYGANITNRDQAGKPDYLGGAGTGLPNQRSHRPQLVRGERNHAKHLLPVAEKSIQCHEAGTGAILRSTNVEIEQQSRHQY